MYKLLPLLNVKFELFDNKVALLIAVELTNNEPLIVWLL